MTQKNAKQLLLVMIAIMVGIMSESCGLADDFDITDDFPSSFLGEWEETGGIRLTLRANSMTYDGDLIVFDVISRLPSQGKPVFAADSDDADIEADFYFSQPNGTEELRVSLTNADDDYTKYFRVMN